MSEVDRKMLLSAWVDGEVDSDTANALLIDVLRGDEAGRIELLRMLQLRQSLTLWRRHHVTSAIREWPLRSNTMGSGLFANPRSRHALLMAAGLAICLTAWLWYSTGGVDRSANKDAMTQRADGVAAAISRDDAARVLAAHEAIVGPVAWLAVSSDGVQVQSSPSISDDGPAVACFLRIHQRGADSFLAPPSLIICRSDRKAALTVPAENAHRQIMQIELIAVQRDGAMGIQYAISLREREGPKPFTTLVGFLPASGSEQTIGQLAHGGTTLDVAMHAAVLPEEVRG